MHAAQAGAGVLARERLDHGRHVVHHRRVGRGRHGLSAIALGQRHDAERQRDPAADLRQRRSAAALLRAVEPHQLRGAAADIEQHRAFGLRIDQRAQPVAARRASVSRSITSSSRPTSCATRARKSSPFSAERQASVAISRARVTPLLLHLVAADRERADRALDRRLADTARGGDALAEPDDAGERVDHAEAVAGRTRDQQAAIVGAEIERGVARPAAIAAQAAVRSSRQPPTPPGPRRRCPIDNGAEARGIPGLAAHRIKPSCRPRPPPSAQGLAKCSLRSRKV